VPPEWVSCEWLPVGLVADAVSCGSVRSAKALEAEADEVEDDRERF